MAIFETNLDGDTEKKFERFLDEGGTRQLTNILLKKTVLGGLIISLIANIVYYQEGVVPYFGTFSILSATQFTVAAISFITVIMGLGNIIMSRTTYILLSRKTEIDYTTVLAATVIGEGLSKTSKSHLLIKKKTQLEEDEVKKAFTRGKTLTLFILIALIAVIIGLSKVEII